MSDIRLLVRDIRREIHAATSVDFASQVVAALSAEPETIAELDAALARFRRPTGQSFFAGFERGPTDRSFENELVVVDLAARLVMYDCDEPCPEADGYVPYDDPPPNEKELRWEDGVRYHLSADWLLLTAATDWREQAAARRKARSENPPLDARAVLYGNPLLEFIASECLAAFGATATPIGPVVDIDCPRYRLEGAEESLGPVPSEQDCDQISKIHARWMLEPHADLRGRPPREVLLEKRSHIDWDQQDRCEQWTNQKVCPPGLSAESAAFRLAGFGTHEVVKYYELVRCLLWSCRERLGQLAAQAPQAVPLSRGDFLTAEVPRLRALRDKWFNTPDRECLGLTPREIIDHERARLPEAMSRHAAMVDHDCPMCQMMGDMPGPMFWHLDGCNMDDGFAFDYWHRTREEWDEAERRREEFNRRFNAEQTERERLGITYAEQDRVWKRSFGAEDSPELPLGVRLFSIGSLLAEVILDLKTPSEERQLIDKLSRDFGNLREVLGATDAPLAAALVEPVLDRFCETLDEAAALHEELSNKCQDLQNRLRRFLDEPSQPGGMGFDFEDDDSDYGDIPF